MKLSLNIVPKFNIVCLFTFTNRIKRFLWTIRCLFYDSARYWTVNLHMTAREVELRIIMWRLFGKCWVG